MTNQHTHVSRLSVKVVPKASRSRIVGWLRDTLKVAVTAPPEGGRANAAVGELLAVSLEISVSRVRCVSGHTASRKIYEIDNLTASEVLRRLDRHTVAARNPARNS